MVRKVEKQGTNSSCIALNYEIFRELYGIDLKRSVTKESTTPNPDNDPIGMAGAPQDIEF